MLKVGITGGAGYTAGELIRILLNHPGVEITCVQSSSSAGKHLYEVHEGLLGETGLRFCDSFAPDSVDVLFMCGAHGASREFWASRPMPAGTKVIDLAQDYRDESEGFVYGLPEFNFTRIAASSRIANPGCFATALTLALLPLAAAGLLREDVSISAITGSTGAGVKPGATTHFSWRNDNVSAYKIFSHQHLAEIRRTLGSALGAALPRLDFIPLRGPFSRGIFAALHTPCELEEPQLRKLYEDFYADAPFTLVSPGPVNLKQVVGTNKCLLQVEKHDGHAVVCSVIDNLLKGASGQAVQNMNICCGLPQTSGLKLKANAF